METTGKYAALCYELIFPPPSELYKCSLTVKCKDRNVSLFQANLNLRSLNLLYVSTVTYRIQ